jgi:hypothetical protein
MLRRFLVANQFALLFVCEGLLTVFVMKQTPFRSAKQSTFADAWRDLLAISRGATIAALGGAA